VRTGRRHLAPYITAAPTEEQSYFLAPSRSTRSATRSSSTLLQRGDRRRRQLAAGDARLTSRSSLGYHGIFDRLDVMAEELTKDRSVPKYAQAITLYHLIVEGSLASPGQHFIEDFSPRKAPCGLQRRDGERLQGRAAAHRASAS